MALSLASASLGYAPVMLAAPTVQRASAPQMVDLSSEQGATGPLLPYWDPLGFSSKASPEKFARWRATEIKHGRIAMMATVGYIAQDTIKFGGYLSSSQNLKFADMPSGIAAWAATPDLGKAQIILFIGLMELATWPFLKDGGIPAGKAPGDVAGDLWVRYEDPEVKKNKLNIELNNGRAAMMGSLGMLMHDHLGQGWQGPHM